MAFDNKPPSGGLLRLGINKCLVNGLSAGKKTTPLDWALNALRKILFDTVAN